MTRSVALELLFGRFRYTDRGILDRTHMRFYTERSLLEMLRESGAKHLIADRAAVQALALADYEVPLVILVPDEEGPTFRIGPHHVVPCAEVLRRGEEYWPDAVAPSQLAYLMFTSGSTGRPKGVGVSQVNAATCIHLFGERYGLGPGDTCSQNFELTFDLSVFDMFVCWTRGACLCVPPEAQRKAPGKFYRERGLTLWFSVPSLGAFMERLGQLKARPFPDLKWILFCGERLPISVAMTWQRAMPQAQVENLYGPTEVTIACTVHTMGDSASENAVNGSVPIGWPLEGHHVAILDGDGQIVPRDEQGELCVGGPQVTPGYWNDPEKTQARYFEASPEGLLGSADQGPLVRWYRTGDLVRMDADGQLQHLGRLDDQVKLGGFRVELGEVESVMRHALGSEDVAVIAAARAGSAPR